MYQGPPLRWALGTVPTVFPLCACLIFFPFLGGVSFIFEICSDKQALGSDREKTMRCTTCEFSL